MPNVTVTAPNPDFDGVRVGVRFVDGKGEVDTANAAAVSYFERHGYTVGDADDGRPTKSAKKADWVAYAVAQGADEEAAKSWTRDELADTADDAFDGLAPKS